MNPAPPVTKLVCMTQLVWEVRTVTADRTSAIEARPVKGPLLAEEPGRQFVLVGHGEEHPRRAVRSRCPHGRVVGRRGALGECRRVEGPVGDDLRGPLPGV